MDFDIVELYEKVQAELSDGRKGTPERRKPAGVAALQDKSIWVRHPKFPVFVNEEGDVRHEVTGRLVPPEDNGRGKTISFCLWVPGRKSTLSIGVVRIIAREWGTSAATAAAKRWREQINARRRVEIDGWIPSIKYPHVRVNREGVVRDYEKGINLKPYESGGVMHHRYTVGPCVYVGVTFRLAMTRVWGPEVYQAAREKWLAEINARNA